MATTSTTAEAEDVRDKPYSGAVVYRASFPFGTKRNVELAVALPSFDTGLDAGSGDAASQERLDGVLKEENVPTPYLEEISARLGEMLRRHRLAEMSSAVNHACLCLFFLFVFCNDCQ